MKNFNLMKLSLILLGISVLGFIVVIAFSQFIQPKALFPKTETKLTYTMTKDGKKIGTSEFDFNQFKDNYIVAINTVNIGNDQATLTNETTNVFREDKDGIHTLVINDSKKPIETAKKEGMEMFLKYPLEKGTNWEVEVENIATAYYTIESVNEKVETPYKTFKDVIKVCSYAEHTIEPNPNKKETSCNYYANGYGLIKSENKDMKLELILEKVEK